jgi:hypothetical protein
METNHSGKKILDINFPFLQGISLKIRPVLANRKGYPSSRLQKGLIIVSNGQELAEEGVGFGVPVLKQGVKTIFAGEIELTWSNMGSRREIEAIYFMNLEEMLISQSLGSLKSESLYRIKNHLADLYRRAPLLRDPLTFLSNMLRSIFRWQTVYEEAGCNYAVKVNYSVDPKAKTIKVTMDTTGASLEGITEVILMNEQGAHHFDIYSDASGLLLKGDAIGKWDLVTSETASFLCSSQQIAFTLGQINGSRLFRGRESIDNRLAWSGFGYSFHPSIQHFTYTLEIGRSE